MIPIGAFLGAASSAAGGMSPANAFSALSSATSVLTGKFNEIVNVASRFVSAINPALITHLNQVFHDLDAVIGVALIPIIEQASLVVRGVADALLPLMKKLNPIINKLATTIQSALQPVIDGVAGALDALMPVVDQVADFVAVLAQSIGKLLTNFLSTMPAMVELLRLITDPLMDVLKWLVDMLSDFLDYQRVYAEVLKVVIETITEFLRDVFGGGRSSLQGAMKDLREGFRELLKAVILTAAKLFKLMGWSKMLDAIIRGVENKKGPSNRGDSRGMGVAQNVQIVDAASIGRTMAQATFAATMIPKKDPAEVTNDWLKDIAGELEAIRDSDGLKNEIRKVVSDHAVKVVAAINGQGTSGGLAGAGQGAARGLIQNPGSPAGMLFGAILGAFGK